MPDIPDFVSPIDGRVINGRAGLRQHNKDHNVTNVADYTKEWEGKAKEREKFFTGAPGYDSQRRTEHLRQAYESVSKRRRK